MTTGHKSTTPIDVRRVRITEIAVGASVEVTQGTDPWNVDITSNTIGLATEATLSSIKDTDGIKKITDALPAGTNKVGKVSLTDALGSDEVNVTVGDVWGGRSAGDFGLDANARLLQLWPTGGFYTGVSGDNNFYSQIMSDEGGVIQALGQIHDGTAFRRPTMNAGNVGAGTLRVVLASDQPTVATSVASLPLPTGAATESTLSTLNGKVTACNTGAVTIGSSLPAGTNAIGKLAANSGVDIGDVDVTSQPSRDRTTDNIGVAPDTNAVMNDTTVLTPQRAIISGATSGNNTLVAAVSGKNIRVLQFGLVVADDVDVRFEDGAGGTALTGVMSFAANSGINSGYCPLGHFETSDNTLLNMELSAAVQVSGWIIYLEV